MRERPLTEFLSSEKTTERKENPAKRKEVKGPWELPEGWRWVRLGDLLKEPVQNGYSPQPAENPTGVWILSLSALSTIEIEDDTPHLKPAPLENKIKEFFLQSGDILVSRANTKELVGLASIYTGNRRDVIFPDLMMRIRVNEEVVDKKFLVYWLRSPYSRQYFASNAKGTTQSMAKINQRTLIKTPVPIPPLSEQKRIVAKLDELNKRIEEAKRLARKAREEAERLMASALHEVFSKAEEKGWEWEKLSELVSLESGSRPKGGVKEIKQGIPSLGAEHLRWDGSFNFKNIRFVPIEFYNSLKKGKIRMSDILLVKDGATTGKVAFVGKDFPFEKACVNEHLFILRKKKSAPDFAPKFLFYALMSPQIQNEIRFLFSGSAQGGINQRFAKFLDVPLPPLEEQKRIVAYLDSIHERAQKLVKLYEEREKELEKLFPAILDRAFRGEV